MTIRWLATLCILLLGSGCVPSGEGSAGGTSSSSSLSVTSRTASPVEQRQTSSVSYTGVVEPAGISIYMQGTHRLSLEDGRFILLESDAVDLNGYVDETVSVVGSLRPTVESDAMIMTVDAIELQRSSSSSSEKQSEQSASSAESENSAVSVVTSSVSDSETSSSSSTMNASLDSAIEAMTSEDFSDSQWTRQYCTGHIGFCIPVHRNWWFKSFGASTGNYWHVEVGPREITNLGEGPIVVRLVDGSADVDDATVLVRGSEVTGYRLWTDNRHFEIISDVRLQPAIEYMTQNLSVYDG